MKNLPAKRQLEYNFVKRKIVYLVDNQLSIEDNTTIAIVMLISWFIFGAK